MIAEIKLMEKIMSDKIKYFYTMFLILLISSFSCKGNGSDNLPAKSEIIPVKWEKISAGFESAETQKKPLLIFFYTEWCIYCKKMNSEVFDDPEISKFMNENFISIRVNPEKEIETFDIMGEKLPAAKLMAYTGSNGFPTTLFLDNKKKPITTVPGFIEKGTFLSILKYLKAECYENKVSLDNYIKNPDLCRARKI